MMEVSKKKTYAVILILGGVALVVDRLILSESAAGPRLAVASEAAPSTNAPATPDDTAEGPGPLAIPELPFPRDVARFSDESRLPDLFASPRERLRASGATDSHDVTREAMAARSSLSRAAFEDAHRLDGVFIQQRLRIAVIDGKWSRIGEKIDGCTVEEIASREVRFACKDGVAVLTLNLRRKSPGG